MANKPYLIASATDKKYGDFLIEHWLFSLQKNVNLEKIDILILDYGLSKAQKFYLDSHNVILKECKKDGHIANIRYRDLLSFLLDNPHYEQILCCDGGDIIFQDDISHLFEKNNDSYRAVCEKISPAFEYFITPEFFYRKDIRELQEITISRKAINGGFIIAPYDKMIRLCETIMEMVKNKTKFGPDQIILTYTLYRENFVELPGEYNFIPVTSDKDFYIENGIFYDADGKKIPVVHNAGNLSFFRAVDNFGYGEGYNILKTDILNTLRAFYTSVNIINKPRSELLKITKKIENYFKLIFEENRTSYYKNKKLIQSSLDILKKIRSK